MTAFSLSWWNNSARFLLRGMNMIWDSVEILHFSCIHMELTETRIHSIRDRNDFHKILITPHDLIAIFVIGWTMVPDVCSCNLINCHLNDLSLRFLIWFDVGLTLGESVMELKNALAIRWISSVSKLEEMKTVGCPPSPPPLEHAQKRGRNTIWQRRLGNDILLVALGDGRLVGCYHSNRGQLVRYVTLRYVLVRDFGSLSGQISERDSVKRFPATGNFKLASRLVEKTEKKRTNKQTEEA